MIQHFLDNHQTHSVHFIGIGGISMSAIAEVLFELGYIVTGTDVTASKITDKLLKKGIGINIGHHQDHLPSCDLVVFTAAIDEDNPELLKAKDLGISIIDRAEMLGLLMKKYKNSIAISGTHGKTTTTSMISLILEYSQYNPTIMIGGELDQINGNLKIGGLDYFVTEACEYVESFLKFFPTIGVILNIDEDHLDYFRDMDHIIESFTKFALLIPENGYLIAFNDDDNIKKVLPHIKCNVATYGKSEGSDYIPHNIFYNQMGFPSFDVYYRNENLGSFQLSIPGRHNIDNALAAIACSHILGVPIDKLQQNLGIFKGTHRRFDILGKVDTVTIIDDYAHHPTEVKATLEAAKRYPHNRLWCIFQPHTYTRTKALLNDFASSFHNADAVIITDIYAAREKDSGEIHSRDLAEAITHYHDSVLYFSSFESIIDHVKKYIQPEDLIITMGAGNIYEVGEMFLAKTKA